VAHAKTGSRTEPNPSDIFRIAQEAGRDARTVIRAYLGQASPMATAAVCAAAARLGVAAPAVKP
jgi:hypothetical protein